MAVVNHSEGRLAGRAVIRLRSQDIEGLASNGATVSGTHDSESAYYVISLSRQFRSGEKIHTLSMVEISRVDAERLSELRRLKEVVRGDEDAMTHASLNIYDLEAELGISAMPKIRMFKMGDGAVEKEGLDLLNSGVVERRDLESWQA